MGYTYRRLCWLNLRNSVGNKCVASKLHRSNALFQHPRKSHFDFELSLDIDSHDTVPSVGLQNADHLLMNTHAR